MSMPEDRRIIGGSREFAGDLLVELASVVRGMEDGELVTLVSDRADVGPELERWSRLTGHALVQSDRIGESSRWVVRKGEARYAGEPARPIGSRVWLYTNFDCNLSCDYCCVRSSPRAERRALGLEEIRRLAAEARECGVEGLFVTGGEPFLLREIGDILSACADAAPTTVLTNGMLFNGSRLATVEALPRDRIAFQISIDSPTPDLHDLRRGRGSWSKAVAGVRIVRDRGFRVRVAATVSSDRDEASLRAFLDREAFAEEDRVIRRIALRGFATEGVALTTADLVPETTITAGGVYWHPVGADDDDFLVTPNAFPLRGAIEAVHARWRKEREVHDAVAEVFRCA